MHGSNGLISARGNYDYDYYDYFVGFFFERLIKSVIQQTPHYVRLQLMSPYLTMLPSASGQYLQNCLAKSSSFSCCVYVGWDIVSESSLDVLVKHRLTGSARPVEKREVVTIALYNHTMDRSGTLFLLKGMNIVFLHLQRRATS